MAFGDDGDNGEGPGPNHRQARSFGPAGRAWLLKHAPTATVGETEMPYNGWYGPYQVDPHMYCPPTWAGPTDEAACTASGRGFQVEFALVIPNDRGQEATHFHWVVADKAEDAIDMACTIVLEDLPGAAFP